MNTQNYNNINFTARMDISKITKNKELWNDVAQAVESKTKKADVTIRMDEFDNGTMQAYLTEKFGSEITVNFNHENLAELLKMSKGKIIEVFKNLVNLTDTEGSIYKKANKFVLNLLETNVKDIDNSSNSKFWDTICEIANKNTAKIIEKDPFLRKLDIEY